MDTCVWQSKLVCQFCSCVYIILLETCVQCDATDWQFAEIVWNNPGNNVNCFKCENVIKTHVF